MRSRGTKWVESIFNFISSRESLQKALGGSWEPNTSFADEAEAMAMAMAMHRETAVKVFTFIALISLCNAVAQNTSYKGRRYAVVFDAGSTGSRVHVYGFEDNMELIPINGVGIEFAKRVKPGLSAYADNPEEAANSIKELLHSAVQVVPENVRSVTPVRLGATAGLRQISDVKADKILAAVRKSISSTSGLKFKQSWVSVLDGSQEGSYMWITVNYLLSNLGKSYPNTVGIVDLGGGSVQMAYAISEEQSKKAPKPKGDDTYISEINLYGIKYQLYVYSYLNYGILAARGKILNITMDKASPCVLKGYNGTYTYDGISYKSLAPSLGGSFHKCRKVVRKALNMDQICNYEKCTFGGVWNGGGGDGQKDIFLASYFYDRANEVGVITKNLSNAKVSVRELAKAAQMACAISYRDAEKKYPNIWTVSLPYVCMDLVYQYSLLVDGFGIKPQREVTFVDGLKYKDYQVDVSWAVGGAIDLLTTATKSMLLAY